MVPPFLFFLATVGLHLCPVGKRDCCPSPHGLVLLIPSIRTSSGMLSRICSTVPSISQNYPRKEPVESYNSSCVCSSLGALCFHSDPQSAFVSLLTNFTVTHFAHTTHLLSTYSTPNMRLGSRNSQSVFLTLICILELSCLWVSQISIQDKLKQVLW